MSRLLRLGKIGIVVVVLLVGGQVVFGDGVGSGPNPEVVSSSKPATELVSQDARVEGDGQVFSGTIQNTEDAGDIFVTLWLGSDTPEQLPDTAAGLRAEGFERVRTKTVYFDSGERSRSVRATRGSSRATHSTGLPARTERPLRTRVATAAST